MIGISQYCHDKDNSIFYCYNCTKIFERRNREGDEKILLAKYVDDEEGHKVLICSKKCKHEFDVENEGDVQNIKKVYRLISESNVCRGTISWEDLYSQNSLKRRKKKLDEEGVEILYMSPQKENPNEYPNYDGDCFDDDNPNFW